MLYFLSVDDAAIGLLFVIANGMVIMAFVVKLLKFLCACIPFCDRQKEWRYHIAFIAIIILIKIFQMIARWSSIDHINCNLFLIWIKGSLNCKNI